MAKRQKRPTERRVRNTKIVIGGQVILPDGRKGIVRNVFGSTKNPGATVVTSEGKPVYAPFSQLTPTAGRPVVTPVKATPGTISEAVVRGQVPDYSGRFRDPIPEKGFQKLIEKGVLTRGGGGTDESGLFDPSPGPKLVNVRKRTNDDDDIPFSSGGIVRRKSSFKGTF